MHNVSKYLCEDSVSQTLAAAAAAAANSVQLKLFLSLFFIYFAFLPATTE